MTEKDGCPGWCGACPTPCFLGGGESVEPDDFEFDDSGEDFCPKWADPDAECDCNGGYFCYEAAELVEDEDFDA